jgi:hypothetical protein
MRHIQKRSVGQKIFGAFAAVGSFLTGQGCIESYNVNPQFGVNVPVEQRYSGLQFNSAMKYGVAGGMRVESGANWELGITFYQTQAENAVQVTTGDVTSIKGGVTIPVFERNGSLVYVTPQATIFSEKADTTFPSMPGVHSIDSCTLTGLGVGVGARFKLGKNRNDSGNGDERRSELEVRATYTKYTDPHANVQAALDIDVGYVWIIK